MERPAIDCLFEKIGHYSHSLLTQLVGAGSVLS